MADGLIFIRYFLALAVPFSVYGATLAWYYSPESSAPDAAGLAGLALAVTTGVLLLPKGTHPLLTAAIYVVAMTVTLWFLGVLAFGILYPQNV